MDVKSAHDNIQEAIKSLENIREGQVFTTLVNKMESLLGCPLEKPRTAQRQTLRSNHHIDCPKEYYRVSMYIPYIDHLVADLKRRFDSAPTVSKGMIAINMFFPC